MKKTIKKAAFATIYTLFIAFMVTSICRRELNKPTITVNDEKAADEVAYMSDLNGYKSNLKRALDDIDLDIQDPDDTRIALTNLITILKTANQ